jgi:acetoin utilization deacetylase AcuC-like enzyme
MGGGGQTMGRSTPEANPQPMTGRSFDPGLGRVHNGGMSQPPLTVYYSPAYAVDGKMETVSKSKLVAGLIEAGEAGEVWLEAPKPATRRELELIHEAEYVRHTLEDEGAFLEVGPWSRPLLDSILASTGGMRDAVKEALKNGRSGSLSSGLHHARRNSGNGFCQFNGLALAALEALKKVKTVGILDLDAHAGGGTFDILGNHPQVCLADVTVNAFDSWEPTDRDRHFYVEVAQPKRYLEHVEEALNALERVDFLIYNAGMDTYEKAGGMKGITKEMILKREKRVVQWARARKIPHVFALAGGYKWGGLTLRQVAELHLETVEAFAA